MLMPLASSRPPPITQAGLIAFWDDDASADRFISDHPIGQRFSGGLHARLRPLRAFGTWPGLPVDVPAGRAVSHQGPVMVLTLGRLRGSQLWESTQASVAYAFGKQQPAHTEAMAEQQKKEFHHQSAFIRFAPTRLEGALAGSNSFDAATVTL